MIVPFYQIPPGLTFWQALQRGYVPRLESSAYLEWVASLPCCVSGMRGVEVHHLIGHGVKGNGEKTPDLLAIPLAPALHRTGPEAIHVIGHRPWEVRFGSQLELAGRTLLQAVYEGVLTL